MKVFLLAASMAFATIAFADPIGPNCGSCNGGIYTLAFSGSPLLDADLLHETYRITFTLDTSGVQAAVNDAVAVDSAAIKVSSSSPFAISLFQAPGGLANWILKDGGVNAAGCQTNSNGFSCADWVASGPGAAIGGTLIFVFDVTVDNGTLFTALDAASIKARFVDVDGGKVGDLLSEPITLQTSNDCVGCNDEVVPEPGTWTLILSGLGLAGLGWKRRQS